MKERTIPDSGRIDNRSTIIVGEPSNWSMMAAVLTERRSFIGKRNDPEKDGGKLNGIVLGAWADGGKGLRYYPVFPIYRSVRGNTGNEPFWRTSWKDFLEELAI